MTTALAFIQILFCGMAHASPTVRAPNILVLNSYHNGYSWSDEEMRGITETFTLYNKRASTYIEYLDTKRYYDIQLLDNLSVFLAGKYRNTPLDVIIAADNNALDFAIKYRDRIRSGIPLVFCGINGFHTNMLKGASNVVGVIESSNPRQTIEIAKEIIPGMNRIYVLHDYTPTGLGNRKVFEELEDNVFTNMQFMYSPNEPLQTLLNQISTLPNDAIVFMGAFVVDSEGTFFDYDILKQIDQYATVPIFPLNETMFRWGGLGGALNSPYMEGKEAAELAIELLNGTPISSLPLTRQSPRRLIFNYEQMRRHNVNMTKLPPNSSIINRPASLYTDYPGITWSIILMFLLFVLLISFLLRNIVKRHRAELELERHRQHLEHLVVERTRKLEAAHARLEARAKELKRANEYKSSFLAHISHEVRTPLNAIIGFSEIILYSKSIDFIHQQSQTILYETEHLLSIINQLLDHEKIEAGKFVLEARPFDLKQLLVSLHKSLRYHARRKNITLEYDIESIPPFVVGDALRLRQILLNLLSNGIKFTREGSVSLKAEVLSEKTGFVRIRFSITDTGIGIPAEKLPTIFHHYSQGDESTTRKFGGTGLGTTIAFGLVKLMGGRLEVDSTMDKGSRFWFDINMSVPDHIEQKDLVSLSPVNVDMNSYSAATEAHVLIADDYPSNQSVVRIHLQNVGYTCRIANNGAEAVARCREESFDLILMDISMPVMNGYDATREIRQLENTNAKVPILALSAHAGDHVRQKCLEAGMNDIIIKPIHRSTFIQQIDRWLSRNELAPELHRHVIDEDESNHIPSGLPIDYTLAIHEFAGHEELVIEALRHFTNDVRAKLPSMVTACQDLDTDYIEREAHKIAGAAGNLRATPLALACKQLEELCKEGQPNPGEVMNFLSRVIDCFSELIGYLADQHPDKF